MGAKELPILYKDNTYVVWNDNEHEVLTLSISVGRPANRLLLDFSYREWQALCEAATNTVVPENDTDVDENVKSLYGDGMSYMSWATIGCEADDITIALRFIKRLCTLELHYSNWQFFVRMVTRINDLIPNKGSGESHSDPSRAAK